jgi:hypothetical protein
VGARITTKRKHFESKLRAHTMMAKTIIQALFVQKSPLHKKGQISLLVQSPLTADSIIRCARVPPRASSSNPGLCRYPPDGRLVAAPQYTYSKVKGITIKRGSGGDRSIEHKSVPIWKRDIVRHPLYASLGGSVAGAEYVETAPAWSISVPAAKV